MPSLPALAHHIPVRSITELNTSIAAVSEHPACNILFHCRNVKDILLTCGAVIFICTWVAVHPNVPNPKDHTLVVWLKYILVAVFALMGPELMVLWSIRQWVSAEAIWKKYRSEYFPALIDNKLSNAEPLVGYGWTQAHAYLVVMGGFALYDGEEFLGILADHEGFDVDRKEFSKTLSFLREAGIDTETIPAPVAGRQHIKDTNDVGAEYTHREDSNNNNEPIPLLNSNARPPTCLLELLLVNGFIDITEDEVMARGEGDTLSKVIVIGQVGWFVLQCATRLVEGLLFAEIEVVTLAHAAILVASYHFWWNKPLRVRYAVRVAVGRKCIQAASPPDESDTDPGPSRFQRIVKCICTGIPEIWKYLDSDGDDFWQHYRDEDEKRMQEKGVARPEHIPRIAVFVYSCIREAILPGYRLGSLFGIGIRPSSRPSFPDYWVYAAALAFGGIHFLAWWSTFPTDAEQMAWRISTVVLISAPLAMAPFHKLSLWGHDQGSKRVRITANTVLLCLCILYVGARTMTIVLAFTTLRDLSYSTLQAVEWTEFIPHIG
ncbi:hypothetical protein VNI00_016594 [Paramarasmius palmivorus]|uniref:Uncharacterized protein n=1 Tax=Paramarasmius palmivorus TaxID=297713 RepID=A0AAW0BB29_9AGAR